MNLLDSHDTDRLGSMIVNVDSRYDHNIGVADNHDYKVRKPNADEVRIQKLIIMFQMTYLGAPMVYYGDEAGMWGADDPDERKPMLWNDMKYEDESHHPFGLSRPVDRNEFNKGLFEWYRKLIGLRRSHPALSLGDFTTVAADDVKLIYAFKRSYKNSHVLVVINNSDQACNVSIPMDDSRTEWKRVLSPGRAIIDGGILKLKLKAKTGEVLEGVRR